MVRAFDWRDLPRLHRSRSACLWLDNALALTQWQVQAPLGALLAYLGPATGLFTLVAESDPPGKEMVIGQAYHAAETTSAHLLFVTPAHAVDSPALARLLDHLAAQAGQRGAQNLLAEVDETLPIFEVLRRAGFAIFSRQRIWLLPDLPPVPAAAVDWRPVRPQDEFAIRTLYGSIVPPLVQQAESPPWERLEGFVLVENGDLLGFVQLLGGPRGVLALPVIHPSLEKTTGKLASLFANLPNQGKRPVYVVVRSHQGWLESAMEDLNAASSPLQAVMVKRLAISQKAALSLKIPTTVHTSGLEGVN